MLRELEGRSYNEIAELLGLTTAALETLLFRARRSLADELENLVTCQSAELAMSKQLDGRLSRKEKRRLDDHLAECADCARLAQTHSRQRRAFKGLAVLPLPIGLALFKGAPNAAAAASLPTIGAGGITSNGAGTAAATAGAGGTATGAAGGAAVGGSLVAAGLKVAAVIVAATVATGAAYRSVEALRDSGAKVAAVAPVTHGTTGSAGAGPLRSSAAQAATQQPATTGDETAPGGAAALGTGAHVVDAEQADDSAPDSDRGVDTRDPGRGFGRLERRERHGTVPRRRFDSGRIHVRLVRARRDAAVVDAAAPAPVRARPAPAPETPAPSAGTEPPSAATPPAVGGDAPGQPVTPGQPAEGVAGTQSGTGGGSGATGGSGTTGGETGSSGDAAPTPGGTVGRRRPRNSSRPG